MKNERPGKTYIDAELVADSRDAQERIGFRDDSVRERRMLYRAGEAFVELLVPGEDEASPQGGWLYGQLITPTEEAAGRFAGPVYAALTGGTGCTGAARLTAMGDFAVPYWEPGDFELEIEPSEGPVVRVKFSQ